MPLVLLPLCFGCGKQKNMVHHGPVSSCEARLIDVPFPFDCFPKELGPCDIKGDECAKAHQQSTEASAQVAVLFSTVLSRDELGDFYHKEMERQGWKELFVFNAENESLFSYEKPFKFCTISVRASSMSSSTMSRGKPRHHVYCFVSPK